VTCRERIERHADADDYWEGAKGGKRLAHDVDGGVAVGLPELCGSLRRGKVFDVDVHVDELARRDRVERVAH